MAVACMFATVNPQKFLSSVVATYISIRLFASV